MNAELPPKKNRIEIYTDASWFQSTNRHPKAVGGWGAAIVEHRNGERILRLLSGPTSKKVATSVQAEVFAVLMALKDLCKGYDLKSPDLYVPQIDLYTDCTSISEGLNASGTNLHHRHHQLKKSFGDDFEDVSALVRLLNICVHSMPGSHQLPGENLNTPEEITAKVHRLANDEARENRDRQAQKRQHVEKLRGGTADAINPFSSL